MQALQASPPLAVDAPLSVLLVGAQEVLAAGVRHALESDGVVVSGVCHDLTAACDLLVRDQPDLCLVLAEDGAAALPAVEQVRAAAPAVEVVVLSRDDGDHARADPSGRAGHRVRPASGLGVGSPAEADADAGETLLRLVLAGAAGWLSLDMAPEVLGRTLRGVRRGEPAVSRRHVGRLVQVLRHSSGRRLRLPDGRLVALTAREHETLRQLTRDTGTAGVAARLEVSESTARWHIAGLVRKLGATSRQDAVRLAGLAGPA